MEAARTAFREEVLSRRGQARNHYEVQTSDGKHLRVLEARAREHGTVSTLLDLTEDVKREAELRVARRAADAASAAKTEFLASMSHELRTPLNAVLGFAQLLRRDRTDPLSERQLSRVAQIVMGGEHLLTLIDHVLDLSRIELGDVWIQTAPVPASEMMEDVSAMLQPLALRALVQLDFVDATGMPALLVDRARFVQILVNLGLNAIKYNRAGGNVRFRAERFASGVRVSVADTGAGIPMERQPDLFTPFNRAGKEMGPIEGIGVGLAISRRLAELMGCKLGFGSVPSRGSTFWIDAPIEDQATKSD